MYLSVEDIKKIYFLLFNSIPNVPIFFVFTVLNLKLKSGLSNILYSFSLVMSKQCRNPSTEITIFVSKYYLSAASLCATIVFNSRTRLSNC